MMADTDEKINKCIEKHWIIYLLSVAHRLEVWAKNINPTFVAW